MGDWRERKWERKRENFMTSGWTKMGREEEWGLKSSKWINGERSLEWTNERLRRVKTIITINDDVG